MKKVIIVVILFFCFMVPVKADLTSSQENDVSFFAEHFILEGSKRIGNDGLHIYIPLDNGQGVNIHLRKSWHNRYIKMIA